MTTNIIEKAINEALNDTNKKDYYSFTRDNAHVNIYIANLNAYNAGELIGAWVSLPLQEKEIENIFKVLKYDIYDNEYAIHDYETDLNLDIQEYTNIYNLNELVETLESLEDYEIDQLKAHIEATGDKLQEALERYENDIFYPGYELIDLAYEYIENMGAQVPDFLANYIDYEAIARDLSFDGYTEVSGGVICIG